MEPSLIFYYIHQNYTLFMSEIEQVIPLIEHASFSDLLVQFHFRLFIYFSLLSMHLVFLFEDQSQNQGQPNQPLENLIYGTSSRPRINGRMNWISCSRTIIFLNESSCFFKKYMHIIVMHKAHHVAQEHATSNLN